MHWRNTSHLRTARSPMLGTTPTVAASVAPRLQRRQFPAHGPHEPATPPLPPRWSYPLNLRHRVYQVITCAAAAAAMGPWHYG
eukprot:4047411-Amphidinium_carterae.1